MVLLAAQQPIDKLWLKEWSASSGEATIAFRQQQDVCTTLYSSWFCPFAQRAWIALEEKGVPYRWVEINPYEVDATQPGGYTKRQLPIEAKRLLYPDFLACSPRGLVPALEHEGERVRESLVLCEYIDERFAGPPLLPKAAHERARVRAWTSQCDVIQRAYYTMLMAQDDERQQAARAQMFDECRVLAREMAPLESGPFFTGRDFGLLDIVLAPFWQRFELVGGHYRGLTFPTGAGEPEFSRLEAWWNAVRTRPSVAATLVCAPRLIASYSDYSQNKGTSDYAKSLQTALGTRDSKAAVHAHAHARTATFARPNRIAMVGIGAFALGVALGAVGASGSISTRS